jgi:hypothetical protein
MPAVDEAVRGRAEARAAEIARDGVTTRVLRRGEGRYSVEISGEAVFAREFGQMGAER